jgi:hypothetical protein
MRALCVLFILCASVASCSSDDGGKRARDSASAAGVVMSPAEFTAATKYVGVRYDSLPAKFTFVSGSLIPIAPGANSTSFDMDLVRTPRGQMVWLDSIVAVSQRGRPTRIVRAELKVPPLAADERLVMSTCSVDGQLDPRVVAIVVSNRSAAVDSTARFTAIRQAWRAVAGSGQFDVIPVTGITCDETGS